MIRDGQWGESFWLTLAALDYWNNLRGSGAVGIGGIGCVANAASNNSPIDQT